MNTLQNIAHGKQTTNNININNNNRSSKKPSIEKIIIERREVFSNKSDTIIEKYKVDGFSIGDIKEFLYARKCVFKNYDSYKIASFRHQNCKNFDPLFNTIENGFENIHFQCGRHIDHDVNYNKPLFKLHVFHNTNRFLNVLLPGNIISPAVHKADLLNKWTETELFRKGNIFYSNDDYVLEHIGPDLKQIFGLNELDPKGIVICTEYEIRRDNIENINPVTTNNLGSMLRRGLYNVYERFKIEYNVLDLPNIIFNRDITKDISNYVTECLKQQDNTLNNSQAVVTFPRSYESDRLYKFQPGSISTRYNSSANSSNNFPNYNNTITRDNYKDSIKFRLMFYIPESDFENESILKLDSLGISIINGCVDHETLGEATYRPNPLLYMRNDKKNTKGNTYNITIITHGPYPIKYYINIGNKVKVVESKVDKNTKEGIYLLYKDTYNNVENSSGYIPLEESESVGLYLNIEDAENNANIDKRLELIKLENTKLKLDVDKYKTNIDKLKAELDVIKSENNILAEKIRSSNIVLDYEYKIKNNILDIEHKKEKHNLDILNTLKDKEVSIKLNLISAKFELLEASAKAISKLLIDRADKLIKLKSSKDIMGSISNSLKDGSNIFKTVSSLIK